jgi:hypothetical protein
MYIRPDKTIIKNCLQALLEQLYWNHLPVVTVAADCLITFAQNSSLWSENDGVCHLFVNNIIIYYFILINIYYLFFIFILRYFS